MRLSSVNIHKPRVRRGIAGSVGSRSISCVDFRELGVDFPELGINFRGDGRAMLGVVPFLKLGVNLVGNQIIIPRGEIGGRIPWTWSVSRRVSPCVPLEDLSVTVELDVARRETFVLARARGPRQPPGAAPRLFHLVVKVADLLFAAGFAARP